MKSYYCPGSRKIRGQRVTIADRIRMRKARKKRERGWKVLCG
jgi:hypothetical protein